MATTVFIDSQKIEAIADGFRERDGTTTLLSLDEMAKLAKQGGRGLIEDIPSTPGQWACLARASQMRDLNYTVKGDVLTYKGELYGVTYDGVLVSKGETLKSIWYSSVRALDWGFIGYAVSMYSFMTCLNNPKSLVYTKKYSDYFNDWGGNIYGTNCTEFISYCHDLPYLVVTDRLPYLECMCDETGNHNMDGMCWDATNGEVDVEKLRTELKLCDVLNGAEEWGSNAGHAIMVTGIRRDVNGLIQEVDITHSTVPTIKKKTYSWDSFCGFITKQGYRPYRVSTLANVSFPENLTDIVYSDICTNRGDKVCIRPNQDISLNVLNVGDYTGIALFKDGVQVSTYPITADAPDVEVMTLETAEADRLSTGKYTAVLYKSGESVTIDDANANNSTSFIVCDVSISRTDNDFAYTAEAIGGVYPKPMQIAVKNSSGFTLDTLILDIDNFSGNGTSEFNVNDTALADGAIIHMPFKTEYGFIIAEGSYNTELPKPEEPAGENLVISSIDTEGNIYNGSGYKDDYRFKSTSGVEVEQTGSVMTGYIACQKGEKFKVSGAEYGNNSVIGFYTAVCIYNTSYEYIAGITGNEVANTSIARLTGEETGDGYVFTTGIDCAFIRFSMKGSGANMVVTKIE